MSKCICGECDDFEACHTADIKPESVMIIEMSVVLAAKDARIKELEGYLTILRLKHVSNIDLRAKVDLLDAANAKLTRMVDSLFNRINGLHHDITTVAPSEEYHRGYNQAIYDSDKLVQAVLLQMQGVHNADGVCPGMAKGRQPSATPLS